MKIKNIAIIFSIVLLLKLPLITTTTYLNNSFNNAHCIDLLYDAPILEDILTTK